MNTETTAPQYAVIRRHSYYPGTYNAPTDTVVYVAKTLDFARKEAATLNQSPDPRYGAILLEHGQAGADSGEVALVLWSGKIIPDIEAYDEQIAEARQIAEDQNGEVLFGDWTDNHIYVVSSETE